MAPILRFLIILFMFTSLLIAFLGLQSHRIAREVAPSTMTYYLPDQYQEILTDPGSGFKLIKFKMDPHPHSSKQRADNELNPQPVLYIPGHYGSYTQASPAASFMHNQEDLFHFFALDFTSNPNLALHSADLYLKAAFANEAIEKIISIYREYYKERGVSLPDNFHVNLIGHSYGGLLARMTPFLSNHPSCSVKNILLFSSPLNYPPASPDSSLLSLYKQVNSAWNSVGYKNSTSSCQPFNKQSKSSTSLDYLIKKDEGNNNKSNIALKSIRFDSSNHCSTCINDIILLSFSGGELDIQVDPHNTNLFDSSTKPRNVTFFEIKEKNSANSKSFLLNIYTKLKNILTNQFSNTKKHLYNLTQISFMPTIIKNYGNIFLSKYIDNEILTMDNENCEVEERVISPDSQYSYITKNLWEGDISPYTEPIHFSFRTSQLKDINGLYDHLSYLWSAEFLSYVHSILTELVTIRSRHSNSKLNLLSNRLKATNDLLKALNLISKKEISSKMNEVSPVEIENLEIFVGRNHSNYLFSSSSNNEYSIIQQNLKNNPIKIFSTYYILRYMIYFPVVFSSFLIFITLSKCIAIIFFDNKYTTLNEKNKEVTHQIFTSFDLFGQEIIQFWIFLSSSFINKLRSGELNGIVFPILSVLAVLLANYYRSISFKGLLAPLSFTLLNIGLSFVLRSLLALVFWILTKISNLIISPYTSFKESLNKSKDGRKMLKKLEFSNFFKLLVLVSIIVTFILFLHFYVLSNRIQLVLGSFSYNISLLYVTFFVFSIIFFVLRIKDFDFEIFSFYLLSLFFTLPSILFYLFSYYNFSSSFFSFSILFQSIHSDQLTNSLCLLIIFESLRRNILSPFLMVSYDPYFFSNFFNKREKKSTELIDPSQCYHEDGGEGAVFCKEIINNSIVFKVVSCKCSKNKKLKTQSEWCEYCRCPNCGGKGIVFYNNYDENSQDKKITLSFSLNFVVLLSLLLLLFYIPVYHANHFCYLFFSCGLFAFITIIKSIYGNENFIIRL